MATNGILANKLLLGQIVKILSNSRATLHTRPRRALLYVPGDDEKKLQKAINLDVDCVIFDCEDGVAINRKEAARTTISKFLCTQKFTKRTDFGVRINSIESGQMDDDLRFICGGEKPPKTLFLPKVNSIQDLRYFAKQLKASWVDRKQKLDLFLYAESCTSVMDLPGICSGATELSNTCPFQLAGIVFGSDDFCASLGATRSESSVEILYARQRVVLVAKAFNLQAVDMVYIDLHDDAGLKAQAVEGASFGYTGKQAIHPKQVPIIQTAFMPSPDKVMWAKELLKEYKSHQESGQGAFTFKGKMIDAPTVKQAQNVLEINKLATPENWAI